MAKEVTGELEITRQGRMGVIALNRSRAINALNRPMVDGILDTLTAWCDDDGIASVLFEGRGDKGFCAGGDVRAARDAVLAGQPEVAHDYFAAEYAMNLMLATYPKPTIALAHGIVMGGGIGIAGHCRHRVTTPHARWAMPEAAIGFFSDVGVNAILSRTPMQRVLPFLMAGLPVGPGDAQRLGLVDAVVAQESFDELRVALQAAAAHEDIDAAIRLALATAALPVESEGYCLAADRLLDAGVSWDDPASIVAAIAAEPGLAALSDVLPTRCPTSLVTIVRAHLAARDLPDVASVLALDLRLALFLSVRPDFAEGVRAVLVDKDQSPVWSPDTVKHVDFGRVASVISGV